MAKRTNDQARATVAEAPVETGAQQPKKQNAAAQTAAYRKKQK